MLFIKFITVVAFAVLGIEVFVGKVLSCKMNLFVDIFELLFGIFHLFTSKAGLVFVPMVIPEIVIAVAFLGLTGAAGISKGFGVMVCAHTIFILPYIIVTFKSRFADYDVSIEEASLDLGANQIYTFIHIICPMILPGIFTGGLMAFSLSFDDLIVSNFLSNTGYTTLPVKIYSNLKEGISPEYNALFTIIFAVMLIATAAIAIKKKRGK